jgi:hypothetical protein
MAYTPTLEDTPGYGASSSGGYQPSLEDTPGYSAEATVNSDLEQPDRASSFFKGMAQEPAGYRPEMRKIMREGGAGALQGLANIPPDTINIFKPGLAPRVNFAPDTESSRFGEAVAPFAAPTGIENAILNIPKIGKAISGIAAGMKGKPINALMKALKMGGETGYVNALSHPDDARAAGLEGFEFGAPLSLITQAATSASPLLGMATKMGIGGGLGYMGGEMVGHPLVGAATGAGFGARFPVRALLGMEPKSKIAADVLEDIQPKDVAKVVRANKFLKTSVTPGQATGNPVVGGYEGGLQKTRKGAQAGYRHKEAQKEEQKQAVNELLDSIYKPTKASKESLNKLYETAYRIDVKPHVMQTMKQDPIIQSAIESVKRKPAFSEVPETNYKFLHQVDRTLGRQARGAAKTNPNEGYEIGQVQQSFSQFLKKTNPFYRKAQEAAQPGIVRKNVQKMINRHAEDYSAKNIYMSLLDKPKKFDKLMQETANFPVAQKKLKNMQIGWKNFANIESSSSGEHTAKKGLDQMRNLIKSIETWAKDASGVKGDVSRLDFAYGKEWPSYLRRISKIKKQAERNQAMLELVTKIGTQYGLTSGQTDNLIEMMKGSGEDG